MGNGWYSFKNKIALKILLPKILFCRLAEPWRWSITTQPNQSLATAQPSQSPATCQLPHTSQPSPLPAIIQPSLLLATIFDTLLTSLAIVRCRRRQSLFALILGKPLSSPATSTGWSAIHGRDNEYECVWPFS
jgi:hypothetical protein